MKIFYEIKELPKQEKFFWCSAYVYFFFQFLAIAYLNLFKMPHFTGYDASAYYVLSHEMVKQGTIMVDHFVYNTTTMLWDSPLLLAAFFHLFMEDIFLCYGLANVISSIFLTWTVHLLCKAMGMEWKGELIALIFLFTPYVSNYYTYNDLGYVSMLFISMGAYAWRLPCILWVYILFLEWDSCGMTKTNCWKFVVGFGFLILNSISSGSFILVFGIAPLLVFVILRGLWEDKWWNIHHNVLMYVGIVLFLSIASQFFTRFILKFEYLDTSSSWISLGLFFENLQNMFLGFLELLGAIPLHQQVSVFEMQGLLYGLRLFITFILFFGVSFELWKGLKGNTSYQLMACFLLCHILIFSLLDTKYGANIFEIRYLIFSVVVLFSLFGCWIQRVTTWKNKSFRYFLAVFCSFVLISIEISSLQMLESEKTDYETMKELADFLGGYEDTLVYFAGESQYFMVLSANMRAVDFSKVYKYSPDLKNIYHCGDYNYFDDNGAYVGGSFLITVPWMFQHLDQVFQNAYELIHSYPDQEIYIYYADENPVDLVSGFENRNLSRDFPYSAGVNCDETKGIHLENGSFLSNGTEGVLCSSKFLVTEDKIVDFKVIYQAIEGANQVGWFQILCGDVLIEENPILFHENQSIMKNVSMLSYLDKFLTYQILLENGSVLEVISFEMEAK